MTVFVYDSVYVGPYIKYGWVPIRSLARYPRVYKEKDGNITFTWTNPYGPGMLKLTIPNEAYLWTFSVPYPVQSIAKPPLAIPNK